MKNDLQQENAELKAQINALSALNSTLYSGAAGDSDEIDLRELWRAIWSGRWLIVGITSFFAVVSVIYALSLPNQYKSTAILAPASSSSASSLSKLAGQFGGLASLAGINLGAAGADDKSVVAMELMKTWGFLEKFIQDNQIEVEVFAAEGWNRSTNQLVIDDDLYDVENQKWIRDFDPSDGETAEPNGWELFEEFSERVSISQDKDSGLIRVSVEYYSPYLAKEWTDKLVAAMNMHIQKQDREEAEKSIAYLKEQINKTTVAEMQTVFYQLIEEQTKTLMLAEVSDEYVFKTMSEAKVALDESKPKRALICIFITFVGGFISLIIVLFRNYSSITNNKNE